MFPLSSKAMLCSLSIIPHPPWSFRPYQSLTCPLPNRFVYLRYFWINWTIEYGPLLLAPFHLVQKMLKVHPCCRIYQYTILFLIPQPTLLVSASPQHIPFQLHSSSPSPPPFFDNLLSSVSADHELPVLQNRRNQCLLFNVLSWCIKLQKFKQIKAYIFFGAMSFAQGHIFYVCI